RYWYFDGLGSILPHATDRVYIQSPSFLDLEILRSRKDRESLLKRQKEEDPFSNLEEWLSIQDKEIKAREDMLAQTLKQQQQKDHSGLQDDYRNQQYPINGVNGTRQDPAVSSESKQNKLEEDESIAVEHDQSEWSYYSEPEQVTLIPHYHRK